MHPAGPRSLPQAIAEARPLASLGGAVPPPVLTPIQVRGDSAAECLHTLHGVGNELPANDLAVTQSDEV